MLMQKFKSPLMAYSSRYIGSIDGRAVRTVKDREGVFGDRDIFEIIGGEDASIIIDGKIYVVPRSIFDRLFVETDVVVFCGSSSGMGVGQ